MTSSKKEIIHLSLGPSANAVSAHLLNLYGLAGTGDDPVCDAEATHRLEYNYWVPRALLVDEATNVPLMPADFLESQAQTLQQESSGWAGRVERVDTEFQRHQQSPDILEFFKTASTLAYSSHSRFFQDSSTEKYRVDSENPRHVVWDDDEEEEESDEHAYEDPSERRLREQRERRMWYQETAGPVQTSLEETWSRVDESALSWTDYLMPPYSKSLSLILPYTQQSAIAADWDFYQLSESTNRWKEAHLSEQLRQMLEKSDYCQSFAINTEGYGIYAGLTTSLLHELQEECKSASRFVTHIQKPDPRIAGDGPISWQAVSTERLRKWIQSGLTLSGLTENAHAVLPIHLAPDEPIFRASAHVAACLEASTMPFRLKSQADPRSRIGLYNPSFFASSGAETDWGSTARYVSMGEYLSQLLPSPSHSLLELDSAICRDSELIKKLKTGTSIERDQRTREHGQEGMRSRPLDVAPGAWLNDVAHGGLLHSMSSREATDRSNHHNLALACSLRATSFPIDNTMTMAVEGMGIRYRPEKSVTTIANESVSSLTVSGYGVGAYWGSIFPNKGDVVLSILGNTTRSHGHARQICTDMQNALGPRMRGFFNRDVVDGNLPEQEDCEDALATCLDVRDLYTPPNVVDPTDFDDDA